MEAYERVEDEGSGDQTRGDWWTRFEAEVAAVELDQDRTRDASDDLEVQAAKRRIKDLEEDLKLSKSLQEHREKEVELRKQEAELRLKLERRIAELEAELKKQEPPAMKPMDGAPGNGVSGSEPPANAKARTGDASPRLGGNRQPAKSGRAPSRSRCGRRE